MEKIEIIINGTSLFLYSALTESDVWKSVAETAFNIGFTDSMTILVRIEDREAKVSIEKVDTKVNKKEDKISISLIEDNLYLPKSKYPEKMLRRIDSDLDIRSRYDLRPNSMGEITINIGNIFGTIGKKGFDRIEDGIVGKPFPSQLYWLRYYEKLSNGYKDYTESLLSDEEESKISRFFARPDDSLLGDSDANELYTMLTNAAKNNLANSGIVLDFYSDEPIYTKRQATSARKLYLKMCESNVASNMNKLLEDFVAIAAPKFQKGTKVSDFMVPLVSDNEEQIKLMAEKLEWAETIVLSMEAVNSMKQDSKETYVSPFGDISISKLSLEEMNEFISANEPEINSRQRGDIVSIYDIKPNKQIEKYEEYLANSFGKKESLLFHGSPTCNWSSIISSGLLLNPNAAICGKAFGNGIYFAPDSDKSAGYMSNRGSRWRSGGDDIVVMGIYRVATGNCYHGTQIIGGAPEKTAELKQMFQKNEYDCFWYKANSGSFVRDEVIVYDEAACVLDKLIIMKAR